MIKTPDGDVDVENEEHILLKTRVNLLIEIATRLGKTKDKDNIMRECREQFYDKKFESKLDQNRYLLCFLNGVIDFKDKRFRKGYPEDYISKCTQTDYHPLDPVKDKTSIAEIHDYFNKLFPIPELCTYMWDHLASVIIGDTAKTQCLHYYTGIGQNGKSMLVKLIQMILGDYATELDVSFFVNERPSRGKATPEIMCLVGSRFAVTAEPSEGEKLNEGPMKALTSGTDKITYRGLFKDQESFIPQVHSVIMANHYLPVKSRDHGTWRRIRVIKFLSLFVDDPDENEEYQFKQEDDFDEKFKKWGPIFMSMLIEIAYVNQGALKICPKVKEYSDEYKKGQDYIAEFISDKIIKAPSQRLKKEQVLEEFTSWYTSNYQSKIVGKKQELFNAIDKEFGGRNKEGTWDGITLKTNHTELPSITTTVESDSASELSN
jgi:P4 family phage/plasmid primase-like protien